MVKILGSAKIYWKYLLLFIAIWGRFTYEKVCQSYRPYKISGECSLTSDRAAIIHVVENTIQWEEDTIVNIVHYYFSYPGWWNWFDSND